MNELILITLLTLFIGISSGWVSLYLFSKWWKGRRLRKRVGEARIAEEEAGKLLEAKGFKIIDRQRRSEVITYVDGKPNLGYVQADFIVSKKDKVFVAEVKSGAYASDVADPAVRRQLLEYDFVYKPDGILLVDMVQRRIHMIEFGLPEEQKSEKFALIVVGLIIVSVLAGLLFLYIQLKLF